MAKLQGKISGNNISFHLNLMPAKQLHYGWLCYIMKVIIDHTATITFQTQEQYFENQFEFEIPQLVNGFRKVSNGDTSEFEFSPIDENDFHLRISCLPSKNEVFFSNYVAVRNTAGNQYYIIRLFLSDVVIESSSRALNLPQYGIEFMALQDDINNFILELESEYISLKP